MPRLTNKAFVHTYTALREAWLNHQQLFGFLTPRDQWYLHDYFRPSEALTSEQLLAHRAQVTKQQPSLPQSAGRAFTTFCRVVMSGHPAPGAETQSESLRVFGVVQPELNLELLALVVQRVTEGEVRRNADSDRAAA